jgi:hypothetical protein
VNKVKVFSVLCGVACVGLVVYGATVIIDEAIEAHQASGAKQPSSNKGILTTSERVWLQECAKYTPLSQCLFRLDQMKQNRVWH